MSKMSDQVRQLVGLENLLKKARRRHRECEREEGSAEGPRAQQYAALVERLSEEIHSADRGQLEDYLKYVEGTLLPRIAAKVDTTKEEMLEAAVQIVDGKTHLTELRLELMDALDRVRTVRERLDLDPFKPVPVQFGLGAHPPNAERHVRDAHALVKEYLKS